MKIPKSVLISIPILCISLILLGFSFQSTPQKDKVLIGVLRYILKNWHYEPKQFDDAFSKAVCKDFIDEIDPVRRYFTKEDIHDFLKYETLIDDQLKREDLSFYNLVVERFQTRLIESESYYKEILSHQFNFDKKETIQIDYENLEFAKNKQELYVYWRKQTKFNTLSKIETLLQIEKDKAIEDSTYVQKAFEALEAQAREKSLENLDSFYKRIKELDHTDWFATFVNSIAEEFDPHTTYFAPKIKELFDINMSGKIEGIGARLQQKNDYTKIVELISGGPAWKQGDLEVGDVILKVAQTNEESVDIVGMRLDDAIKLIKGKKGTQVTLTVKKVDNSIQKIPIVRDVVELEETFVKSSIVEKEGKKYGVINLPKFYIDFNDLDGRNSGSDMAREIQNLKNENIEGLLIDLRDNGGGSLQTAIEIGGLFIEKGPIVQVKYRDNEPVVKNDYDPTVQWNGPLVILVNELSASASEILAAAMQDYKRAVIIGSKQTYGKGTVQNVIPLNKSYNYPEDLGAIKLTIQKFYRINGGSTQLEGVRSDIAIPSKYSYVEIGERDQQNPLKWDKIPKANYAPINFYQNFDEVVAISKNRIAQNQEFLLIDNYAKWLKESRNKNSFSLNYKDYLNDQKKHEKRIEEFKDVFKHNSDLAFTSPLLEIALTKKDTVLASKRKAWHEDLSKDIYIDEAIQVLSELKVSQNMLLVKK
jgi:carboxyl-terminal processing protease